MGGAVKYIPQAAEAVYSYFAGGDAPKTSDPNGLSGTSGDYVPNVATNGDASLPDSNSHTNVGPGYSKNDGSILDYNSYPSGKGLFGNKNGYTPDLGDTSSGSGSFGPNGSYTPDLGDTSTPGSSDSSTTTTGGGSDNELNFGDLLKGGLGIAGGLVNYQDYRDKRAKAKQLDADKQDTANRREATYRARTEMLQGAIADYYKKHGIPLPDSSKNAPGTNTTRQLPYENPLYNGQPNPRYPNPLTVNPQLQPVEEGGTPSTIDPGFYRPGAIGGAPLQTNGTLDPVKPTNLNTNGQPNEDPSVPNPRQISAQNVDPFFNGKDPDAARKALYWKYSHGG